LLPKFVARLLTVPPKRASKTALAGCFGGEIVCAQLAPEVIDDDAEPDCADDPKNQLRPELDQRNIELFVGRVPISVQLRTP
jgi:hypothetical protein